MLLYIRSAAMDAARDTLSVARLYRLLNYWCDFNLLSQLGMHMFCGSLNGA